MNETREFYQERIEKIQTDSSLSDVEKVAAVSEIIDELCRETGEEPEKSFHSPGMFDSPPGEKYYVWDHQEGNVLLKHNSNPVCTDMHRAQGICCKTEAEAKFVHESQELKRDIIDRLKVLNDGRRPDWSDHGQWKYEPWLDEYKGEVIVVGNWSCHHLPDNLQAKSEEIWLQVIEEFGAEKVRKALWPVFVEEG